MSESFGKYLCDVQQPYYSPEESVLFILELGQWSIRSGIVVVNSFMILVSDEVFDLLPAKVRLALLVHHQVAEDQQEAVTRDIESSPQMTMTDAGVSPMILGHLTHPSLVLDSVEERGDGEPDQGGQGQPRHVVLDDVHPAAAVGVAGEVDEVGQEQTSPEPAALDKPLIDQIVRVGPVTPETEVFYKSSSSAPLTLT